MYKIEAQELDSDGSRQILLEADGLPLVSFNEQRKSKFKNIIYLSGIKLFVLQTDIEKKQYSHLEPQKITRIKKDKTTPLFGELPNVYKG